MLRPGAESRFHGSGLGARDRSETHETAVRRLADAAAYCLEPRHLRRTAAVAVIVGLVLTTINQLDVIVSGDADTVTWLKSAANFVVPFVVANVGLLSGARKTSR